MPAQIFQPDDPLKVESLCIVIFGPPGVGKTSLAQTGNKPFTMDFDKGTIRSFNRKHMAIYDRAEDFDEFLSDALLQKAGQAVPQRYQNPDHQGAYVRGLGEFNSATENVIDTCGRLIEYKSDVMSKMPKLSGPNGLSPQGWGVLKKWFSGVVSSFRLMKKDLILVCHEKEDKKGEDRYFRMDIPGGSYTEVFKQADAIGYLTIDSQGNRTLDFIPSDTKTGKDPAGLGRINLGPFNETTNFLGKNPKFLDNLIKQIKGNIGNMAEAHRLRAIVDNLIARWNEWVKGNVDPEHYTTGFLDEDFQRELSELSSSDKAMVWGAVKKTLTVAGLVPILNEQKKIVKFDKAAGQ